MFARGPDGKGEWYDRSGRVGLGHRRLAIIDLSNQAAQPMIAEDGDLVISFNGEIYNYLALRGELEQKGYYFRTHSDTEVLLHLYSEKGEAMVHDLRGMFAFALWDVKKQAMFLARDPSGIKPCYYSDDGQTFRVASQVKALLCGHIDTRPEPAGHVGFFLWGSVPEPYTLYKGIRALPAGHTLIVDNSGAHRLKSYARITDILRDACHNPADVDSHAYIGDLTEAIRESISAHLVADVPVGVFLSAGLDSTLIAGVVAETGGMLRTITLGFDEYVGKPEDETILAEETARLCGASHSTIRVQKEDFQNEREKLLAAMDQPATDGVNTWFVARAAASQGLKVTLSGLGGDELFASYPSFQEIPKLTTYVKSLAGIPGLGKGFRWLTASAIKRFTSPKYASLLEYGGSLSGAYLLRRGLYMPWELPEILDPDMVRMGWRDLHELSHVESDTTGICSTRLAISSLEMNWYMRNQLLRDADWAGMAHSLEIRVPLVDTQLLRQASRVFAKLPGLTKSDVVAATIPGLPENVLTRPKTGFTIPVRDWLQGCDKSATERGMRGWARYTYEQYMRQGH